jgi:sec-independent protein translocase protein TatA
MGPIGIPELIIVLVILLVIFGPKRLPGLGRSLGSGMREFKDSISGESKADDDDEDRRALEPAPAATTTTTPAEPARPAEQVAAERREETPVSEPRA